MTVGVITEIVIDRPAEEVAAYAADPTGRTRASRRSTSGLGT